MDRIIHQKSVYIHDEYYLLIWNEYETVSNPLIQLIVLIIAKLNIIDVLLPTPSLAHGNRVMSCWVKVLFVNKT